MSKPGLCDVPIDPDALQQSVREFQNSDDATREGFREKHAAYPMDGISVNSDMFIAFWEMCNAIAEGTHWKIKTRIVLEYDPQKPKMQIRVFKESAEKPHWRGLRLPTQVEDHYK